MPAVTFNRIDIVLDEKENTFTVYFELPGLNRDEISLNVENGLLVVKGESKFPSDNSYVVNERKYGKFQRAVCLPCGITVSHFMAVLLLRLFLSNATSGRRRQGKS
jgi:HSP20 family protein